MALSLEPVPLLIVVDRAAYTLDVYRWRLAKLRYNLWRSYSVTVGRVGAETPHGMYFVQGKSRTPDWKVPPNPDYPQEIWGQIYSYDDLNNPFEGGFIALGGKETGVGLHGTKFDPRTGTASSHGCVRMKTPDLLEIYGKCRIGTPVYLH